MSTDTTRTLRPFPWLMSLEPDIPQPKYSKISEEASDNEFTQSTRYRFIHGDPAMDYYYDEHRMVNQGMSGTVFKGHRHEDGHPVAIKRIDKHDHVNDLTLVAKECDLLCSLAHL